jgi:hypothetical protein
MKADYATSDLITKVNTTWINEVLANPELSRAEPGDDVAAGVAHRDDAVVDSDLRLRGEFARKRTIMLQRDSTRRDCQEPDITIARPSRRRSVARRIAERLALAVVALVLASLATWMAPEPQDATSTVPARIANASPEFAAPVNTTELRPAWLLPEILYGPAMARSPLPAPRSGR